MNLRKLAFLFCLSALLFGFPSAKAQFSQPPVSATTIPTEHLIQADVLNKLLQTQANQPLVLQVGSKLMFAEAHIRGSQYVGPGSTSAGLQALESVVASSPKNRLIVLYCGCCPWGRCPNVGPAFKHLRDLGYTNVKVLYLANNFGDDWVSKGYVTERR